jgi:hypothetical protein
MPDDVSDWLAKLGLSKYVQQRDRHPGCKLLSATQWSSVSKVGIG